MNRYLVRYIFPMIVHILSTMTPLFREQLIRSLMVLKETAEKTPNPVDGIVIRMLLDILDIPDIANSYTED